MEDSEVTTHMNNSQGKNEIADEHEFENYEVETQW